ncbi:MAG: DMT family transporter [Hyphomicrobiaceae bacterium]
MTQPVLDQPPMPSIRAGRERALAHGAMLLFALLVSTSFTVGAAIAPTMDPLALTFGRFIVAGGLFLVFMLASGRLRMPGWRDGLGYLLLGALVSLYFVTMFEALLLTSALVTSALFALVPLITAIMARAWLGQGLTLRLLAALGIAGGGAIWVTFGGDIGRMLTLSLGPGELIYLLGCVSYSAYSPAIRHLDRGASTAEVSFWTVLAGLAIVTAYGLPSIVRTDWTSLPLGTWAGIFHLGIFTTLVSFFLIQFASTRLPQAKVMAYTYLIPVFVVLTDGLTLDHWPSPSVMAGVGVIALAMLVLESG